MARNVPIKVLRTTRANLDAQAGASGLLEGEPYLITDEGRLAVGTGTGTYQVMGRQHEPLPGYARADLDAMATAGTLVPGRAYRISDEGSRIAVADSTTSYAAYLKEGEGGGGGSGSAVHVCCRLHDGVSQASENFPSGGAWGTIPFSASTTITDYDSDGWAISGNHLLIPDSLIGVSLFASMSVSLRYMANTDVNVRLIPVNTDVDFMIYAGDHTASKSANGWRHMSVDIPLFVPQTSGAYLYGAVAEIENGGAVWINDIIVGKF